MSFVLFCVLVCLFNLSRYTFHTLPEYAGENSPALKKSVCVYYGMDINNILSYKFKLFYLNILS